MLERFKKREKKRRDVAKQLDAVAIPLIFFLVFIVLGLTHLVSRLG